MGFMTWPLSSNATVRWASIEALAARSSSQADAPAAPS
jgi:hypothetical protein